MPHSKTRKPKKSKDRPRPDLSRPVTTDPVEAEARDFNIVFRWRDLDFVVDPLAVKFGQAAFNLRVAGNEKLNGMTRMDAAVATLEAAIGQEQLIRVQEVAPDFWDNIDTMRSFWDAYTLAMHGAASGESQAS